MNFVYLIKFLTERLIISLCLIFILSFIVVKNTNAQSFSLKSDYGRDRPLPVELVYFEAHVLSDGIFLRWGTATEVNNYGFNIERADSTRIFDVIGFVLGNGNSNSPKHYNFKDTLVQLNKKFYYRLKQIDTDGSFKYSDTINVFYSTSSTEQSKSELSYPILSQNYPNPFNTKTNINFIIPISGDVSIKIYDVLGNEIGTLFSSYLQSGEYNLSLDASNLASGNYFLRLTQNKWTKRIKITLLK